MPTDEEQQISGFVVLYHWADDVHDCGESTIPPFQGVKSMPHSRPRRQSRTGVLVPARLSSRVTGSGSSTNLENIVENGVILSHQRVLRPTARVTSPILAKNDSQGVERDRVLRWSLKEQRKEI